MALIDSERAVVALCFDAAPEEAQFAALGDARIFRIYRDAVRKRLHGEIKLAFKRTAAAAGEPAMERAFEHFLAEAPPRARFFHAVVGDFARSALGFFARDATLPPHVGDLCAYEAAVWAVDDLPDRVTAELHEFSFNRAALLAPALRLLALAHAVHESPEQDGSYRAGEFYLCLHRPAEEKHARSWTLNAVTFALMQRLRAGGESVAEAVQQVARAREIAVDEAFLDGLCTVLAEFIERGVILGGC